ncbi:hypothetical protein [Haloferula rosea]|uniref:Uncharacterized protein n=1 Tax=Haloferula rosea TaxID=490093 RepID=A0A934RH74_9BACT|nr:hypothetical protein [Haloferula rosea]MBK1829089.1 hypothetical protein [Haloferula rosea]
MKAFSHGVVKLGSVFGGIIGFIYYNSESEEASSSGPFLDSVLLGFVVLATFAGVLIGIRRLVVGKDDSCESHDDLPDDPFGLDRGVTAKSLGGGMVQVFLRSCRDRSRESKNLPNKSQHRNRLTRSESNFSDD